MAAFEGKAGLRKSLGPRNQGIAPATVLARADEVIE
jgi:hypothetical protein